MKKLLVLLALALPLGACSDNPVSKPSTPSTERHMNSNPYNATVYAVIKGDHYAKIGIWVDPLTGCQYFTGEVKGGIFMSPRMENGVAVCHTEQSENYETYQRLKKQYEGK